MFKKRILWASLLLAAALSTLGLRLIPVEFDIFDFREIPPVIITALFKWPILLFDFITADRFAPRGEGFIVFPTAPQFGFALGFDWVVFYFLTFLLLKREP